MTALDRYVRLEALGLWRETEDLRPREVIVSFGRTTLLLSDLAEKPLGHWALAGVTVLRRDRGATIYTMTPGSGETLIIRDPDMVAAIAAVADTRLATAGMRPPRRRRLLGVIGAVIVLGAAALLLPALIRAQAVRMVPPELALEFGDRMLLAIMEARGAPCDAPAGVGALGRLAERLDPDAPPRLRVLDLGGASVAALPGRTVLIDPRVLADAAAPEEVAGWAALALVRDPLDRLLRALGPVRDLRYMLTGIISEAALTRAATAEPALPADTEAAPALAALTAADIDPRPFAEALARDGWPAPATAPTLSPKPVLADQDWVALQGICD
jgi:hypothetical protein